MRSFVQLAAIDPGFNPKNVCSMTVSLAGQSDFVGPKREAFYQQLFQRIEALPGVQSASAINHLPLAGDVWGFGIAIEGRPLPAPGEALSAVFRVCRPKYFATMGMSLARGRDFTEQDRLGSPGVIIINENLARRQFANDLLRLVVGQGMRLALVGLAIGLLGCASTDTCDVHLVVSGERHRHAHLSRGLISRLLSARPARRPR